MLGRARQYILSCTNLSDDQQNLVGNNAYKLSTLKANGIHIPPGFILTTSSFDDFLIANDLISFISGKINNVNYSNLDLIKKSSNEIRKAILSGTFPAVIENPLLKAYENLDKNGSTLVKLAKSPVNEVLDDNNYLAINHNLSVRGNERLLNAVKAIWADLFLPEAMLFRLKNNYEGYLSQAIFIHKTIRSEVSGRVYTIETKNGNPGFYEIRALLGIWDKSIHHDIYWFDLKKNEVSAREIVPQKSMLIFTGKEQDGQPSQMNIREQFQNKQKLDDRQIQKIVRQVLKVTNILREPVIVEWVYEAGEFTITDLRRLTQEELMKGQSIYYDSDRLALLEASKQPVNHQSISVESRVLDNVQTRPFNSLTRLLSGEGNHKTPTYGTAYYVNSRDKLTNINENQIAIVDQVDLGDLEFLNKARGIIVTGRLGSKTKSEIAVPLIFQVDNPAGLILEGELITLNPKNGGIYLGAGENPEVLTPKLQERIQARSEASTPKRSANVPNTQISIKVNNPSKVAITSHAVVANTVIQPAASTQPQPKPAVTLTAQQHPVRKVETVEEKIKSTPDSSLQQETKDKKYDFQLPEFEFQTQEIKTSSNFYQLFDPYNPLIDEKNIDGVIVDMSDFYRIFKVDVNKFLDKTEQKRKFIENITKYLKEVVEKFEKATVVLIASDGSTVNNQQTPAVFGAHAILADSRLFEMEIEILDKLRNKHNLKNIWFCAPNVRTVHELSEIKKIVTGSGFRRSSTFKLLASIATPLGALSIKEIMNNDLDGIIIDLKRMRDEIYLNQADLDESVFDFVIYVMGLTGKSKIKSFAMVHDIRLTEYQLKRILDAGMGNFIFTREEILSVKKLIAKLETAKLKSKKKRGRKKKEINYGF